MVKRDEWLMGIGIGDGVLVGIWWCCAMQHSIYIAQYHIVGIKLSPR